MCQETFEDDIIEFPKLTKKLSPENPVISLVVPVYIKTTKDLNDINNLFSSISKQTLKPSYVILVDDCSPISYSLPDFAEYHRQNVNSGPAKARNIGKFIALNYNSDIIAFADTDCILSKNWIETIITIFRETEEFHILSGNTISYDNHWFGTYHDINGTLNGRKLKDTERLLYGTTANLAIDKEVAQKVDFNENFPFAAGEDIDFCFKANKTGFVISHVPSMIVYHNFGYTKNHFESFKRFRQLFRKYGQGERILINEIPEYYAYFDRTEEIPTLKTGHNRVSGFSNHI